MIDPSNPIFVHSDVGRGLLVAKRKGVTIESKNICSSLFHFLSQFVENDLSKIIFPAFNYDYGKTRIYKPHVDPVQVGALPEWVRTNCGYSRSYVPFYSVLSESIAKLNSTQVINPFGKDSVFGQLVSNDATIILLGTGLSSLTFIHHIEEMIGKPCYRYDKSFSGKIVSTHDGSYKCEFIMHVRPLGTHLDYDWQRLEEDLISEKILLSDEDSQDLKFLKARRLIEYWGNQITTDPLYLLDAKSRKYFEIKTSSGSRRVELEEFEEDINEH